MHKRMSRKRDSRWFHSHCDMWQTLTEEGQGMAVRAIKCDACIPHLKPALRCYSAGLSRLHDMWKHLQIIPYRAQHGSAMQSVRQLYVRARAL